MKIPTDKLKELREQTGAGIMACRNALADTELDMEKALEILKQQSLIIVDRKKERSTSQGIIEAYIHAGGRIGAMVELNCETDFAAHTDEFKELAHNLAMQVAAMPPQYISQDEMPEGTETEAKEACLLHQPYIRDLSVTVQDIINEIIAKVGENIRVSRFARYEMGEQ
ncbi:elongation factor Ts [Chloroflexota bacterium]